jgi:hypothetical protein
VLLDEASLALRSAGSIVNDAGAQQAMGEDSPRGERRRILQAPRGKPDHVDGNIVAAGAQEETLGKKVVDRPEDEEIDVRAVRTLPVDEGLADEDRVGTRGQPRRCFAQRRLRGRET